MPRIGHVYRHLKRNTFYVVEAIAQDCDLPERRLVVYRSVVDQKVWVRSVEEFDQPGRFQHLGPLERPSKDAYFLGIVKAVAARGTCSRRKVGAIAVLGNRILATGYNGAVEGARHCEHDLYTIPEQDPDLHVVNGRFSCSRAIHSEANVLAYAARYGVTLAGATVYCDTYPCYNCAKAMVSAGIKKVIFQADYVNDPLVEALRAETQLVIEKAP